MKIALYVLNLMDRGRFSSSKHEMVFARSVEELRKAAVDADYVFIDLAAENSAEALNLTTSGQTLAYVGHVHEELLNGANAIEGVEALPRSVFFRRLPQILN